MYQSLVGREGTAITRARSVADLKQFRLGAQLGTRYQYIANYIKPSQSPLVYDTNDLAVQALKNGQIDGIVVDLPTAFYVTGVQLDDGVIVGRFANRGGRALGHGLGKGSSLRRCVNRALNRLWANGTIKQIQNRTLPTGSGLRVLG